MKQQAVYVFAQNTIVYINNYQGNADPRFTDEQGYWPLVAESKNLLWQPMIKVAEGFVPVLEIMVGVDRVKIDDGRLGVGGFDARSKIFANIKDHRLV